MITFLAGAKRVAEVIKGREEPVALHLVESLS